MHRVDARDPDGGVAEQQHGLEVIAGVVAGEDQPDTVPAVEPAGVGDQRDAVVDRLARRDGDPRLHREDGPARLTRVLIDVAHAGAQPALGDVGGLAVRADVLQEQDPCRVGRAAGGGEP